VKRSPLSSCTKKGSIFSFLPASRLDREEGRGDAVAAARSEGREKTKDAVERGGAGRKRGFGSDREPVRVTVCRTRGLCIASKNASLA